MPIPGLTLHLKAAKETIRENPIAATRNAQAAAHIEAMEDRLRRLEATVQVQTRLLAGLCGKPTPALAAAIAAEVDEQLRTKSVEELARETLPCTGCGRPVHRALKRCQMCGADVP